MFHRTDTLQAQTEGCCISATVLAWWKERFLLRTRLTPVHSYTVLFLNVLKRAEFQHLNITDIYIL